MTDVSDLIGVPFKEFGRNVKTGLDCYGLAIEVLKRNGKTLKDVKPVKFNYESTQNIIPYLNVKKTDYIKELAILEFYGNKDNRLHVGIAIDKCRFIHATENLGVKVSSLESVKSFLTLHAVYEVI